MLTGRLRTYIEDVVKEDIEYLDERVDNLVEYFNGYDGRITNEATTKINIPTGTINPTIENYSTISRYDTDSFQLLSTRQDYLGVSAGYVTSISPSGASIPTVQGFYYDGSQLEVQYREVQGSFCVIADGELVAEKSVTSSLNQPRYYKIDFGSEKIRKIYLISTLTLRGDIAIQPSSNFYPTREKERSIGVIGDSITAGTGSTFGKSFSFALRWKLGAWDLGNYGIGGSGYINNTGGGKFIDRLQEVIDSGRDVIIVAGGINDVTGNTVEDFKTAVDTFYDVVLQNYKAKDIVIVSNWGNTATVDGSKTTQFRDILRSKAIEIGSVFVDAIGEESTGGWITSDNSFNLPDGTHPNNYMHNIYGHNIAASLKNKKVEL